MFTIWQEYFYCWMFLLVLYHLLGGDVEFVELSWFFFSHSESPCVRFLVNSDGMLSMPLIRFYIYFIKSLALTN